ncbi:bifunctional 2-polyprenyl-6-hydroxyphenol methylase/3-demethylubiquinol 3-O-methyltransferase UbiG [Kitasatospora aureofaciens]|uniref:class I SAM-dependent methyltransferase n=1 Tax=Kitasatospora aureofaciens TaxID=1894 RepID=UPI001C482A50|nr:class I SAM-dependent methyltransferase [Kitasatospora aureofaciens]MBV6699524.1 class I SAM-dependent methyltransferase [Kitasatospora aureofaciens]
MNRTIRTTDDVLALLDRLFPPAADRWTSDASAWWDGFYADRAAERPFFVPKPDENLVSYLDRGLLTPGRALDLGCGPGRNALHLAALGFDVDAVDLSPAAIAWAEERAREAEGVHTPRFHCAGIFEADLPHARYDLVYDSGCLHHLPPHRRISYLALLDRVLAPGGHFVVNAFAAGAMGSELPDEDLYRLGGLEGGLAYSPDELRALFADFTEVEIRPMTAQSPDSPLFGVPFLLTALFRRPVV